MNAVEIAIKKVKNLDEERALKLIEWLRASEHPIQNTPAPLGARAMLGFVRRLRPEPRSTAEWMVELREGEESNGMGG
jgi:hypothetical protein